MTSVCLSDAFKLGWDDSRRRAALLSTHDIYLGTGAVKLPPPNRDSEAICCSYDTSAKHFSPVGSGHHGRRISSQLGASVGATLANLSQCCSTVRPSLAW